MPLITTTKTAILTVAGLTLALLAIPLLAMQFTAEVDWSLSDFVIMGALIFTAGLAYLLITRQATTWVLRLAYLGAIGTTFLLIWSNLAVGLIGAGLHWGNFLYIGVVAVALIGSLLSRFSAAGMERTMYATAASLVLLALAALLGGLQHYPSSSVGEILAVNAFFAFLYLFSGRLFRYQKLRLKQ